MEHRKAYHRIDWPTVHWQLIIEGPVSIEQLEQWDFHQQLTAFRPPNEQKRALHKIAQQPEGRIIVARHHDTIVGYVCFLYPDPMESWAREKVDTILSLGAIEVAAAYRGAGIAKGLLQVAFMDEEMENFLIITTEYYWHWDLKHSGLTVWDYRNMMDRLMRSAGFEHYATDDPEICSHPANAFMARVGKNVTFHTLAAFDRLRFQHRYSTNSEHSKI